MWLLVDVCFNSPLIQLIGQPVKIQGGDKVVRYVVHVKSNACARSESRAGVLPLKSLPASPFPPVFSLVMGNVWVSRLKCAEFQMHMQAVFSRAAACSQVWGSQLVSSRCVARIMTHESAEYLWSFGWLVHHSVSVIKSQNHVCLKS